MRLGDTSVITLLLSRNATIRQLKKEITEAGKRQGARIKVSDQMHAKLTGVGFKVQETTDEIQAVSSEDKTTWEWQIKATEAGRQSLILTLSPVILVNGKPSSHWSSYKRTIDVRVDPTTLSQRVSDFTTNNWQWLWTAILIPTVGLIMRQRKRRAAP